MLLKIVWPNFGEERYILSVDGVHFPILEPRRTPSARWYSHKFNGPGLSYELALSIYEDKLVWINGPFKASTSDIFIFRQGLETIIPEGKLVIGDSGYKGSDKVAISQVNDSNEVKRFKNRARARQESFNGRLKRFKILAETFRYHHEKHGDVVNALCVLTQYDIENGRPLMDVLV